MGEGAFDVTVLLARHALTLRATDSVSKPAPRLLGMSSTRNRCMSSHQCSPSPDGRCLDRSGIPRCHCRPIAAEEAQLHAVMGKCRTGKIAQHRLVRRMIHGELVAPTKILVLGPIPGYSLAMRSMFGVTRVRQKSLSYCPRAHPTKHLRCRRSAQHERVNSCRLGL
jgi:hypothetical protein